MVEPLRAGKLCITVVLEVARVITPENSAVVLHQFFHRSKQEAKAIAVDIFPATAIPRREVVTELSRPASYNPNRDTCVPVQPATTASARGRSIPEASAPPRSTGTGRRMDGQIHQR